MNKIGKIRKIKDRQSPNDVVYTPLSLAMKLIEMAEIQPGDRVLDCSRGGGIFFDNLPECRKDWCEIIENKDFFDYNESVDIIIGNPPYSQWQDWLEKSAILSPRRICYVMGVLNLTPRRINYLKQHGYHLSKIHITTVNGWFGNTLLCIFDKEGKDCITYDVERRR